MKTDKHISLNLAVPIIIVAFIVGVFVRVGISSFQGSRDAVSSHSQLVSDKDFQIFWDAWTLLNEKSAYASTTSSQDKIYGAIEGLASSFGDPYTVFFPPVKARLFQEDISGNFSGVGMEIGIKNNILVVVTPLKGSPAEKAGVKTGDSILSVNGTSTAEMSVDEAVSYIRGPQGTSVKIVFLPKNATKPVERTIVRDVIQVPTIDTDTKPGGISVIKLYTFSSNSTQLFSDALRKVVLSGNHKLIIDLRGNPGGLLDAAVDMSSYFLPAGSTVVTEDFGSALHNPIVFKSGVGTRVFDNSLQLVLLVDGGSASAAEILAGALQENGVAKLVGTKTFGKGSVQELVPLTSDPASSLKITIARWLTPKGHNLSHDGLDPDYVVPITDKDVTAGTDPQMLKAIDILTARP